MKIYLSMSSADLEAVREVMQLIRDCGHEIVYDWTKSFEGDVPVSSWPKLGQKDIESAAKCDLMVLWGEPTAGCYVELGAALYAGTDVIWMAPDISVGRPAAHFFLHSDYVEWCPISLAKARLKVLA